MASAPKPCARESAALLGQGGAVGLLVAVAHTVEAGEVGEGLAGAQHVVGSDGGVEVGKLHLDELGALLAQGLGGGGDGGLDLCGEAVCLHEGGDDADALAGDAVLEVLREVDRAALARGVLGVATGTDERVHGEGHVRDAAAEGAHLVE